MSKVRCYYYRDPNYLVQKYPMRIDIRQLTIKQWEELIEDLNILKNVENLQQCELEDVDCSDNRNELLKQDFA